MSRNYKRLDCGCLISCDGGGGLICVCSDNNPNCKVDGYSKEHSDWCGGYCEICHPFEYRQAKEKGEE